MTCVCYIWINWINVLAEVDSMAYRTDEEGLLTRNIHHYSRARKNLSETTLNYYTAILNQLSIRVNKPLNEIDTLDILDFLDFLQTEKKWKNSSLNTAIHTLRSFFTYFRKIDDSVGDVMKGIEKYREDDTERPYVTEDDFNKLLDCTDRVKGWIGIRDRTIMMLLFSTGIRASELLGLDLDDLDFEERYAVVMGKGRGGKKRRLVPLSPKTVEAIKGWMELRKLVNKKEEKEALFLSVRGNRLSYTSLYARITKYTKEIGRPELATHSYRHGCLTKLTSVTGNIRLAQTIAGHSKIGTTERYVHVTKEETRGAIDRVFG